MGGEHRSSGAALEQAGQQTGGAGVPVDELQHHVLTGLPATPGLGPRALGLHRSTAPGQVEVLDVEPEDLCSSSPEFRQ